MNVWSELKRRNVFRMAILYIVSSWLLLQMGDLLFDLMGVPDWALRLVLVILILGLPVAIVFSWLYELTPEGLKRESEVRRETSITDRTGRKLNALTLVVGIVAIGLVTYQQFLGPPTETRPVVSATGSGETTGGTISPEPAAPSIAVLPFVNLSGSEENEYFSDGLTETLLHSLASIPDLQVAARTSSFAFKGKDSDVRQIAEALGVAHVLEGSVQRAGDRVRITAQLIRASDGFHIWSANFDRTLDDIFAIQDEIAGEVARALSSSLLGVDGPENLVDTGTRDVEAYDLYLRALAETAKGAFGNLSEAERLLKLALAEDPAFVDAKTQLAIVYDLQASTGMRSEEEAVRDSIALLEQVVTVRPGDIRARTHLLMSRSFLAFRSGNIDIVPEMVGELRSLVREAPSATEPRMWLARVLRRTGQEEQALREYEAVLRLDPLNPVFHNDLSRIYHDLKDWSAAEQASKRSLELEPLQPNAASWLAHLSTHTGDAVGGLEYRLRAMELDPQDHELPAGLAIFLYEFGLTNQADRFLSRAEAIAPNSPTVRHAQLQRALQQGDHAKAVEIARGMISDDLDDRHGSDLAAVKAVFREAVRDGTVEEALQFIETHRPGFLAVDDDSVPFRSRATRLAALGAWSTVLPHEELLRQIDDLFAMYAQFGQDFAEAPLVRIEVEALRGNTDAAIQIALEEFFTEPATRFLYWERSLDAPYLDDVVADPRIQEAMKERAEETRRLAEQMQRYLDENVSFAIST